MGPDEDTEAGSGRRGSRAPAKDVAMQMRADRVDAIRGSVTIPLAPDQAFDLFTAGMGTWWPLEDYSRAVSEFADEGMAAVRLEFQPHHGGSILEHLSDGRVLPWAEVIEWRPPQAVMLAWRPHAMPEPPTELEATFTTQPEGTIVRIEHRGWERLSPSFREALYDVYVRGWVTTLARFAAAAGGALG